ncbi:sodium-dependent phosphate transporter 2 isoform X1 [Schistocerca piceifrons]|uniref:sodium-dependent phosphate transporter 2 isoform X1 n=1 Tax=Schistocerca piceifrons TaxID=274613 RepID=UPI001F5F40A9|nr:sodium-dependent phosphate transporter 2 isoform X1 [Schistocerca piceifrons]XP_047105591.1 sodium-dependent phosphate transporter 2 isoform X1 [Schistocerca piceifrons]
MIEAYSSDVLWILIVGFIVAFILAFGIGANDVANSFGTSVGSKVLTVRQACYLATIFETAGAILIGYKVSDTMRKGILDVNLYEGREREFMLGFLSSLAGSAVWLLVATFLKLPISGTHSIVGASVGFSLVAQGFAGLQWMTLVTIVASWFISPVLSGMMSTVLYLLIRKFILRAPQPIKPGLRALPLFYGVTVLINVFSIVHNGPKLLYFDYIPWWGALILSVSIGILVTLGVHFFLVPHLRNQILKQMRIDKGRGVSFTFGDSTESSRDPSPKPSRSISVEDVKRNLPIITETSEPEKMQLVQDENEMVQFTGNAANGTRNGQTTYCFPLPQPNDTNTKLNGYLLAETAIGATKDNMEIATLTPANGSTIAAIIPTQHQQLHPESVLPASGQVTPAFGLSPNSSAVPLIKEKTPEQMKLDPESVAPETQIIQSKDDPPEAAKLFAFLQILTASFGSFAHGGNDVSNAIGPLIALWLIFKEGSVAQESETPLFILFYGGLGISVGLWLWGRRVIQTIGEDLTKITASTGFSIEIGAAFTVLLASKIGLPISTTHCKVGSVVFVGWFSSDKSGVDWKLFRNIIYAWVFTVPVAAGLSAAFMWILQQVAL